MLVTLLNLHYVIYFYTEGQNVALRKPACQSNTQLGLEAWHAVDGKGSITLGGNSCSMTTFDLFMPWWAVDLHGMYVIETIRISNILEPIWGRFLLFQYTIM